MWQCMAFDRHNLPDTNFVYVSWDLPLAPVLQIHGGYFYLQLFIDHAGFGNFAKYFIEINQSI